ncbi:cilia- and flagella-associated protein 61 [Sceloporus undulatus]|uniref:cilia- and flagella-associated protein 61 n=1 Tax=Sceloporus undulatus TaxID=8520 RepID=UPI001C4D22BD|nr:cilia- and flagella-associated protein 61 [Sceloporus undulatus]
MSSLSPLSPSSTPPSSVILSARRTESQDIPDIVNHMKYDTERLFGRINVIYLLEKANLAVTIINQKNIPVAHAAFVDYPNWDIVDQAKWESYLTQNYFDIRCTPLNTLFMHLFVTTDEYALDCCQEILKTVFKTVPELHFILLFVPTQEDLGVDLSTAFVLMKIKPGSTFNMDYSLYVSHRHQYCPQLHVRYARVEDHDDLTPIFARHNDTLQQTYGEYFLAELIEAQDEENVAVVCEDDGLAVGFMSVCSEVNVQLLHECFDLGPFHGLCKPHPEDILKPPQMIVYTGEESGSFISQKEETSSSLLFTDSQRFAKIGSIISKLSDAGTTVSVRGSIQSKSSEQKAELQVQSSLELPLDRDRSKDLKATETESTLSLDREAFHPLYRGAVNAFCIQLFCIDEKHETRSLDFLNFVFNIFPDRDFCLISVPHMVPEFHLIQNFVRVIPFSNCTLDHELYVFHRSGLLKSFLVRAARTGDIPAIELLIKTLELSKSILDDVEKYIEARRDSDGTPVQAFVAEVLDQIVGISVIRNEMVPVQDPHSSCLLCLGKDHDAKACPLCKSLSAQARKNRESRLTSAIALGKRPHKSSGTEGLESRPKSGRKPEGSHAMERTEKEVRLASPSSSKASKSSRHASKPREPASPSGATSAQPPERAKSLRPSSSGTAAVLLDLPDNPFFPPEETPKTGKKRHHKEAGRDPASKKPKRPKEHAGSDLPSKPKDKKRSPSKKVRAPTVSSIPEPAPEEQLVPVPDTPVQPTMDFVHKVEDANPGSTRGERSPPFSHSEDERDDEEVHRQEAPDLFFDSETGRYFMSVPRDVAFKEFTRLNPRPADPREGTSTQSIPSVSVLEKPPSSPRRRSQTSTVPIPVRPRSQVRIPDIPLTSDTDSEDEPRPPSEVPSDEDDLSASASPQRMHHPEPSSPSDDVRSFSEHVMKMARALDIELSFPEDDARDPVERRVHGRLILQFQNPCAHSLTSALHYMVPVRPRRQIVYPLTKLGINAPSKEVSKDQLKYALNHFNRKLSLEPKVSVNARIVVVGASNVAISFLETLIFCPHLKFNNLTLISTHGLPGKGESNNLHKCFLINSHCFNEDDHALMSLASWINVVVGKMTGINRSAKHVIVPKQNKVPYDHLILCTGQQYQLPCPSGADIKKLLTNREVSEDHEQKYTGTVPSNLFVICDDEDAVMAIKWLKEKVVNSSGNVIVYGNTIDIYTTIESLLSLGISGSHIYVVHPPSCSNVTAINNNAIEKAVQRALSRAGVTEHHDSLLAQWNDGNYPDPIAFVSFTTKTKPFRLQCSAFFNFTNKTVDYDAFKAVNDACLVYDGRLVIDTNFHTNDVAIRAAGPLTKFSNIYYANEWTHSNFSSKEIGFQLAAAMLHLFDPTLEPVYEPPEDMDRLIPMYKGCKIQGGLLPGKYNYVHIFKPGIPARLDVQETQPNYGMAITTGDAIKGNYFRIHVNQYSMIETITCFSKDRIPASNYICLFGQHERLLNNLCSRWREGLITDLYSYLKEPWALAIYHDRFIDLKKELRQILVSVQEEDVPSMQELVRQVVEGELTLFERPKTYLKRSFKQTVYKKLVEKSILSYLDYNQYHLPMFAWPGIV